ncbi:MAG: hypothetical protein SF053_05125 [Bacteroidia bacterium]|nr:hypothetical protein [Bacteroidia bacterium]
MKDRKISRMAAVLKPEERQHFLRWLSAELDSGHAYLRALAEVMLEAANPDDATCWQRLYPDQPYDDARLRKLAAELTGYLETYIALEAFREDARARDLYLARALSTRRASALTELALRKASRRLERQPHRDSEYLRMAFELARIRYQEAVATQKGPVSLLLQETMTAFGHWWSYEIATLALVRVNHARLHRQQPGDPFMTQALAWIEDRKPDDRQPLLFAALRLIRLLGGDTPADDSLVEQIKNLRPMMQEETFRYWITTLLNHLLRQHNLQPDPLLLRTQLLPFYRWAIEEQAVWSDGFLPPNHLKNIVGLSLQAGEIQEALRYLDNLVSLLPPVQREATEVILRAYCYFSGGSFRTVISLLSGRQFGRINDEIEARVYLLQAHYELNPTDADWLYDQLGQFIRFLRARTDLSDSRKRIFVGRMQLFRRLVAARTPRALARLARDVNARRDPYPWLMTKLAARTAGA